MEAAYLLTCLCLSFPSGEPEVTCPCLYLHFGVVQATTRMCSEGPVTCLGLRCRWVPATKVPDGHQCGRGTSEATGILFGSAATSDVPRAGWAATRRGCSSLKLLPEWSPEAVAAFQSAGLFVFKGRLPDRGAIPALQGLCWEGGLGKAGKTRATSKEPQLMPAVGLRATGGLSCEGGSP